MVSWATATFSSNQLIPFSAAVSAAAAPYSSCTANFLNVCSPRMGRFDFFVAKNHSRVRTSVVMSNRVSSLQTQLSTWEDPDDGSGSEYDEEDEEMEENDLDYESDWEEERNVSATTSVEKPTTNKYEEDLVKEVEQLLGPEERATLQQNVTPNLGKISTAKWSPLHTLALSGQIPFMDKLIENGLNIDTVDQDGLTALHKAIIGKKEAVISHLLRKDANPHVKDRDGATPLHYAVQVGAMQTVKLLIKYKVDLNVADNDGWTPLHVAIQSRNRYITKVLLVNGADKNRRSKDGRTPLDLSLCYGKDFKSFDLARLLKVPGGGAVRIILILKFHEGLIHVNLHIDWDVKNDAIANGRTS